MEEQLNTIIQQNERLYRLIEHLLHVSPYRPTRYVDPDTDDHHARTATSQQDANASPVADSHTVDHLSPEEEKALLEAFFDKRKTTTVNVEDKMIEAAKKILPRHVSMVFVLDYLKTSERTFYREINDKMIKAVCTVGKRPYFLLEDVVSLMKHTKKFMMHERRSWTFSKLSKKGN